MNNKKKQKKNTTSTNNASGTTANTMSLHVSELEFPDDPTEFELKYFDEGAVDGVLLMLLKQLKMYSSNYTYTTSITNISSTNTTDTSNSSGSSSCRDNEDDVIERCITFKDLCSTEISRQESLKLEVAAMMAVWDRYSDLLKAHDELAQCKLRVTLALSSSSNSGSSSAAGSSGTTSKKKKTGTSTSTTTTTRTGSNASSTSSINHPIAVPTDTSAAAVAWQLHSYELLPTIEKAYCSIQQVEGELQKSMGSMNFYRQQVREIFQEMQETQHTALVYKQRQEQEQCIQDNTVVVTGAVGVAGSSDTVDTTTAYTPTTSAISKTIVTPSKTTTSTCLICQEPLFPPITLQSPSKPTSTSSRGNSMIEQLSVVVLPCAHRYHSDCVARWVKKHRACPLCKTAVLPKEVVTVGRCGMNAPTQVNPVPSIANIEESPVEEPKPPNSPSRSFLPSGVNSISNSDTTATNNTTAACTTTTSSTTTTGTLNPVSHSAVTATHNLSTTTTSTTQKNGTTPSTTTTPYPTPRLTGRWGTKVDQLIRDLLQLTHDPQRCAEKAIVFSQWIEVDMHVVYYNLLAYTLYYNEASVILLSHLYFKIDYILLYYYVTYFILHYTYYTILNYILYYVDDRYCIRSPTKQPDKVFQMREPK